ncbi:hypothetical protein X738_32925 [Mesorhizobium sp. LNHC209A00]|nr:hypothetical protein X738_32925 [Mesorhizobium sp. LNHC209A00]
MLIRLAIHRPQARMAKRRCIPFGTANLSVTFSARQCGGQILTSLDSLAELVRVGWYREVEVKSAESQATRSKGITRF